MHLLLQTCLAVALMAATIGAVPQQQAPYWRTAATAQTQQQQVASSSLQKNAAPRSGTVPQWAPFRHSRPSVYAQKNQAALRDGVQAASTQQASRWAPYSSRKAGGATMQKQQAVTNGGFKDEKLSNSKSAMDRLEDLQKQVNALYAKLKQQSVKPILAQSSVDLGDSIYPVNAQDPEGVPVQADAVEPTGANTSGLEFNSVKDGNCMQISLPAQMFYPNCGCKPQKQDDHTPDEQVAPETPMVVTGDELAIPV